MIFSSPGAIEKILSGQKTQTRRLVNHKEFPVLVPDGGQAIAGIIIRGGYKQRLVGGTYAVQPGRGKRSVWYSEYKGKKIAVIDDREYPWLPVATSPEKLSDESMKKAGATQLRIRITNIRQEDVRNISDEDVKAEGFSNRIEFFNVWCNMHDKQAIKDLENYFWNTLPSSVDDAENIYQTVLTTRPDKFYKAWVYTFEVAK